jgi:trimeric autotransporter adhesin
MRCTSLVALFAFPALVGSAVFGCVGDDPDTGIGIGADGGQPDGQTTDGQGGVDGNDGGADDGEAGVPPYVPSGGSYIKASNTGAYDFFGDDVAVSANGDTMVVGASGEWGGATGVNANQADNSKEKAGAAYVFVKSAAGVWSQQAYLKPSNTIAFGAFGSAVAISADGNRIAVGAKGDNSVYVYNRTQSAPYWVQIPSGAIKASNAAAGSFGYELALSGDGNTLAIGAMSENSATGGVSTGPGGAAASPSYDFSGAVYVWTYSGGNWTQSHFIKASDNENGGRFGWSVALNGAGTMMAVAAMGESSPATGISATPSTDTGATSSGAVYIFEKGTTWNQTTYIKAKNSRAGARFGQRIAMSGSGTTVVVGADFESSGAKGVNPSNPGDEDTTAGNAGAAYVFTKETSGWTQSAYLKASNTRSNAYFGRAVAISYDGRHIVVGSYGESSAATGVNSTAPGQDDISVSSAGAAYDFALVNGRWTQVAYLKAARSHAMSFGISTAVSNGGTTIVVGATSEPSSDTGIDGTLLNTSALASGAVYTFK